MADTEKGAEHAADAKTDAIRLAEEAEAEAAEAEALAAAARARARAIRLRREAETQAATDEPTSETSQAAETVEETSPEPEPSEPEPTEREPTEPESSKSEPIEPESSESAKPTRQRFRATKVALALMVAAVVGICGLLGLSGYLIWHHHDAVAQRQQAAAFVAAAKQGVVNLMSLDFNKAKHDVQRIIDSSTGEFKDDFEKRAEDFTTVVEQSKVVTEGSAKATGVESMGKDSAVVLVLANERVTNSAGAKEEPRAFRLRVSVTREGDQIKMSKVEFVL